MDHGLDHAGAAQVTRLEVWLALLAVWVITVVGAEFHGRYVEKNAVTQKTLADNSAAINTYAKTLEDRNAADLAAQARWADFISQVNKGMDNVQAKFASLPSVVVDAHGCDVLTPDAGMRWNSEELVPAGPANYPAGSAAQPVPASPVPPAK